MIQISLLGSINTNIKNINNSEQRHNFMIDITLRTRNLIMLNEGLLVLNSTERANFLNTTINKLRDSSTNLRNAQNELTLKTSTLEDE